MTTHATLRTYSHLLGSERVPSEYELVTSRLHYYTTHGFEVPVPLADWVARHQAGSALTARDWELFRDPRETTYTSWTALQSDRETYAGTLLERMVGGYDAALPPAALDLLERFVPVARFPLHGLQMVAAYVGHLAPAGRVTLTALFQVGDELRRVQRFAYRMAQLRRVRPTFGDASRAAWQEDPLWQPLREVLEELLVTWDWGEAFVALNLCLKPALDRLLHEELAAAARGHGDYLLGELLHSFEEDARWQRQWSAALVHFALADAESNRSVLLGWRASWDARVSRAMAPLADALDSGAGARLDAFRRSFAEETGLGGPP